MVFQEIFPQALALMTDVFGNYVIQKVPSSVTGCLVDKCDSILLYFIFTLFVHLHTKFFAFPVFRTWYGISKKRTGWQAFWSCTYLKPPNVWL